MRFSRPAVWVALLLAAAASTMPVRTALACSCAFLEYPLAIAEADQAYIGTVTDVAEPPQPGLGVAWGGQEVARYTLAVERAKEPTAQKAVVHAVFGSGANCGIDLGVGERWLIIASSEEGRLLTHLCTGSTSVEMLDGESLDQVEALLTATPTATEGEQSVGDLPWPAIGLGVVLAILALLSALAFRHAPRSTGTDGTT